MVFGLDLTGWQLDLTSEVNQMGIGLDPINIARSNSDRFGSNPKINELDPLAIELDLIRFSANKTN